MKEILTLIIFISNIFQVENDSVLVNMVSFSGYAESEYFKGRVETLEVRCSLSQGLLLFLVVCAVIFGAASVKPAALPS